MGSLRCIVSLDCISSRGWSSYTPRSIRLFRHSSLPNLFLLQTEHAVGVLTSKYSSVRDASFFMHECRSIVTAAKISLSCKATFHPSFNHRYIDGISEFEKSLKRDAEDSISRPFGNLKRRSSLPFSDSMKEAASASESLEIEKSIVYSELRACSHDWQAPPTFMIPYEGREKAVTPPSTLHHPLGKPDQQNVQTLSDLRMQPGICGNDVKDPPMSLRMLKRKLSKANAQAHSYLPCRPSQKSKDPTLALPGGAGKACFIVKGVGDSSSTALASLVYMLKLLQQYALVTSCMQPNASVGADIAKGLLHQNWARRAYADLLDSFLWLFQQVFSRTPKLMLLTMILLADFTLDSMSKHMVLLVPNGDPPTTATALYHTGRSVTSAFEGTPNLPSERAQSLIMETRLFKQGIQPSEHERGIDSGGESGGPVEEINQNGQNFSDGNGGSPSQSGLQHQIGDPEGINIDQATKNMLVAPVVAPVLEADDYPCFDRTDLAYQHEISRDPRNPLLLANYAQFLHVVRHDNGRAEKLYRRAALVDRDADAELMGRFASFLWVAKGNTVEADSAYKAAIAADPTNAYHAGSYAHFLWNSNAGQAEETSSGSRRILGTAS